MASSLALTGPVKEEAKERGPGSILSLCLLTSLSSLLSCSQFSVRVRRGEC